MKKLWTLLLAAMMVFGCLSAVADEAKPLPDSIPEWNAENWYDVPVAGYYGAEAAVEEGVKRVFNLYYPEGLYNNAAIVYITVPAGTDAFTFFEKSGWKQASDENKFIAVLMSPDGAWAGAAEEEPYLKAVYAFVSAKPYMPVRKHNVYMAAYDGVNAGQNYAIQNPGNFVGVLAVDTLGMTAEQITEYTERDSQFYDYEENKVKLGAVVYPMWLVSSEKTPDVKAMISYFKTADRTVDEEAACDLAADTVYYAPKADAFGDDPNFEAVAGVYYTKAALEDVTNYQFTAAVWKNMFEAMRRYPSYGEVRAYESTDRGSAGYKRYTAKVYGGDYKQGLVTVPGEYYTHYWDVYTPSNIDAIEKTALVFVFNGGGGGTNEIAEYMGWRKTAEEKGLILIIPQSSANWATSMKKVSGLDYFTVGTTYYPEATSNRPSDILFLDYMMNWAHTEFEYTDKIDFSRVFASGQSMGGLMSSYMTQYRPYYFAGIAPCSAFQRTADMDESVDIPVINLIGGRDTSNPGGWTNTTMGNPPAVFSYFINRYQIAESNGQGRQYEDFDFQTANPENVTDKKGELNIYSYSTKNGFPMFEAVEAVGMAHATTPSFCEYFYDRIITHYTRDPETLVLYYDGEVVDTPVNLALYEASQAK